VQLVSTVDKILAVSASRGLSAELFVVFCCCFLVVFHYDFGHESRCCVHAANVARRVGVVVDVYTHRRL